MREGGTGREGGRKEGRDGGREKEREGGREEGGRAGRREVGGVREGGTGSEGGRDRKGGAGREERRGNIKWLSLLSVNVSKIEGRGTWSRSSNDQPPHSLASFTACLPLHICNDRVHLAAC